MADQKVSALTALTTPDADDLFYIVDVSATPGDRKITAANLQAFVRGTQLASIAGLTPTDSNIIVGNGTTWVAESGTTARVSLGLVIGTDVQAHDGGLDNIAGLTPTDGNFIVGDGNDWIAESGSTARASMGAMSATEPYHIQVALSPNGSSISTGTKKGLARVPKAGTITAFVVDCDPANEPSATAVQVDLNKIARDTGTATTVLSAVASIATSANTSTGGTIDGTQAVAAGDMLTLDVDQGSDGKELIATITITPN